MIGSLSFIAILITINNQISENKQNVFSEKRHSYLGNIDLLIRESEEKYEYWVLQSKTKTTVSEFTATVDGKGQISIEKQLEIEKEKVDMSVDLLKRKKYFVDILSDYTTLKLDLSNPQIKSDQELDSIYVNGRTDILDKHERYKT